jgi:exopolysaccharide biosynthesis polyprenyl glycosylphosphotransferase
VPVLPFVALDTLAALTASVTVLLLFHRWWVPAALPCAWVLCLAARRAYDRHCLLAGTGEIRRVMGAAAVIAVAASVAWWFLPGAGLLHDTLFALPVTVTATFALRETRRLRIRADWHHGRNRERAVVLGPADSAAELVSRLRRTDACEMEVVGVCRTVDDAVDAVRRGGCEAVIALPGPALGTGELRTMSWELRDRDVELMLVPVLADVATGRLRPAPVAGLPLLELHAPDLSRTARVPKELADRLLAAAGLLLLAPLMLVIAVLIRLDSPGPVLFRHRRVGLHGREFTLLKFRTMYRDADRRRSEVASLNQYGDGAFFKVADDPRITRVGRTLRHWSLDEIPQLFNVLAGRMSLVGPRPLPRDEADELPEDVRRRRLLVKPGLSGLWQVSGRSELPEEERVRLDLSYVENWSTALDLTILARTPGAVVRRTGAY